jgi:hypothetical protein
MILFTCVTADANKVRLQNFRSSSGCASCGESGFKQANAPYLKEYALIVEVNKHMLEISVPRDLEHIFSWAPYYTKYATKLWADILVVHGIAISMPRDLQHMFSWCTVLHSGCHETCNICSRCARYCTQYATRLATCSRGARCCTEYATRCPHGSHCSTPNRSPLTHVLSDVDISWQTRILHSTVLYPVLNTT